MSIDWLPVRKIAPKERGNRGYISTRKNPSGIVEYESCLERNLLLQAIHCPSISRIQHQPKLILYKDDKGKTRKYTPDVYLETTNGSNILVEVKPRDEIVNSFKKYEARWKAAEKWSEENNIKFFVLSEIEINTPRWLNVWFTLGASKCIGDDDFAKSLNLLIHPDGDEYNVLCNKLANNLSVEIGKAAQILCYVIYNGLVFVDTFSTKQLSKDTIIRKKHRDGSCPFKPLYQEFSLNENLDEFSKLDDGVKEESNQLKYISSNMKIDERVTMVEMREEMVLAWLKQPRIGRTLQWREEFYKEWNVSESKMYRLVNRYKAGGKEALYPKFANSGRKKKYSYKALELIEKARKFYLKPGYSLNKAFQKLRELCEESGVQSPKESSFRWYIYKNTTESDRARKKGRKYYKSHFTPSLKSFQGALFPMQVLQLDNTSFDVFPVDEDERECLATPYMTAAIDCYTRAITGFSVSYFPSSSRTILEVLVQSILPKKNYVNVYETQHEWAIEGFPVVILVDNGMDYRSKALKHFCKKYDIIIEFVPLRTPRYKAYMEQWFNVLKNAMMQESIPGLRPTLKQRIDNPDLKPEKEAVLTLQEIETWLHKWIVDDYHFSNQYDDHVLAPSLKLKDSRDGRTDLIFPTPREPPRNARAIDDLYLATLSKETRTLTRNGVQWVYLKYNNKELAEIYKIRGSSEVTILRDKRDVRRIWVINPTTGMTILVGLGIGWGAAILEAYGDKPVNESAWKRNVKAVRCLIKKRLTPYLYKTNVSKQQRLSLVNDSSKKQKLKEAEKIKEATRKNIDSKLSFHEQEKLSLENQDIDDEIFNYKPKGLETGKYPRRKYER